MAKVNAKTQPHREEAEDSFSLQMPHFTEYRGGGLANRDMCKDTFSIDVEVVLREEEQELQQLRDRPLKIGPLTPRDLDELEEDVDEDGYVVEVEGAEDQTVNRLVLTTLNTSDLL